LNVGHNPATIEFMQTQGISAHLQEARNRADEIIAQLSVNPEYARQIQGDRSDVNPIKLEACARTCSWTCSWTSLEA
jgi:hypothetical protein